MHDTARQTRGRAAAVIGAAHLRVARNGQDAASCLCHGELAVAVVCDGCGSASSSELGAQLVTRVAAAAIMRRLRAGASVASPALWESIRSEVARALCRVARTCGSAMSDEDGSPELPAEARLAVEQALLCTVVAAAVDAQHVAVWALGDGACAFDDDVQVFGPFPDNAPPYLAYDLFGGARPATFIVRERARCGAVLVATDGASALGDELAAVTSEPRFVDHPDALRRHLAVLARDRESVLWHERRVARVPALLQDDAAIALVRWGTP